MINGLLNQLSSAYQENAIMQAIDEFYEFDNIDENKFAQDSCEFYREILKDAGNNDIYKAFRKYGDETEVANTARKIYKLLSKPRVISECIYYTVYNTKGFIEDKYDDKEKAFEEARKRKELNGLDTYVEETILRRYKL